MNPRDYVSQNARAWDEIAEVRHRRTEPASHFAAGNTTLNPILVEAAADVQGKAVLQFQCSTGEETISWAVLGAKAEGIDLSPRQIALAREKAAAAGVDAVFHVADVCDLPDDLRQAQFDLLHTGGGSLMWIPDLEAWATSVSSVLKDGGQLLLLEEHPVAGCLFSNGGVLEIEDDYFGRKRPSIGRGWRHFEGGEDAQETKYQFSWPLGDILTALVTSGMGIDRLQEFPSTAKWRFEDNLERAQRLPGGYLLQATKLPHALLSD